jgi:hypothetical protein
LVERVDARDEARVLPVLVRNADGAEASSLALVLPCPLLGLVEQAANAGPNPSLQVVDAGDPDPPSK